MEELRQRDEIRYNRNDKRVYRIFYYGISYVERFDIGTIGEYGNTTLFDGL